MTPYLVAEHARLPRDLQSDHRTQQYTPRSRIYFWPSLLKLLQLFFGEDLPVRPRWLRLLTVSSACARHNRVTHLVFQLLLVEVREDDGDEEVQHGVHTSQVERKEKEERNIGASWAAHTQAQASKYGRQPQSQRIIALRIGRFAAADAAAHRNQPAR